jgi:hypothetical protein
MTAPTTSANTSDSNAVSVGCDALFWLARTSGDIPELGKSQPQTILHTWTTPLHPKKPSPPTSKSLLEATFTLVTSQLPNKIPRGTQRGSSAGSGDRPQVRPAITQPGSNTKGSFTSLTEIHMDTGPHCLRLSPDKSRRKALVTTTPQGRVFFSEGARLFCCQNVV